MIEKGTLIIISGPSGSGKGTEVEKLINTNSYALSISATTRSPRGYEKEGVHYFFKSVDEFKKMIENNEFLTRMMSAIKIRNGMDKTALINHILYSAGSTTSASKVGANTIIEIFKDAGMVREEDGKILAVEKENVIDTNEEIEQNNKIKTPSKL